MNQIITDSSPPPRGLTKIRPPTLGAPPAEPGIPGILGITFPELSLDVVMPTRGQATRNRRERERKQRRRTENRRIIAEEKAHGCWLCSKRELPKAELHFHHVDPATKKECVAHFVSRSTQAFVEEIRGCRLFCSTCHEEHHAFLESEVWRTGGCYDL